MSLVSTVIPTHNRPELLLRALASVYAQTFTDYEVIVVDDGDSPRAESVLGDYLKKPNFCYLETKKNEGAPVARNTGIAAAKGEWIAFLDDDDEWLPEKLEKQAAVLSECNDKVLMMFNGVRAVDEKGRALYTKLPDMAGQYNPLERTLTKCFIWTSSVMIRKSVLQEVGGFDQSLLKNQEWDLQLRLLAKGDFYAINEANTVLHIGESEQLGSVSNLPRVIAGYQRFLDKHSGLYSTYPAAYAGRLFHLGCLYAQYRQYKKARLQWHTALQYQTRLVYVRHYLSSFVPVVYRLLHKPIL